ncbi:hypothetical protein JJB09_03870 [Rhizobium sp. KVB221]|uniref:Uncharacterized protein n=1 Tax=Rhizobium setariae TaxID=2801340 RepID=A0A936YMV5_9HYPH|nr:hypothetical protein [Rhizobium setariae]MBL0371156.1 hypothetical protein [Rhizobium setariae]
MRQSFPNALRVASILMAFPVSAFADGASDVIRIFGRDPGIEAANACFVRHYTKAHLAGHPEQNVTDMLVYVSKQEGSDPYYSLSMQVNFRQLEKPFQVSGSCGVNAEGKSALGCGVECDGGHLGVRVKNDMSLLVEIPESVRLFDPAETGDETDAELPNAARFGSDDKLFRLDRTALKDCAAVIYDDDLKGRVLKGAITH